MKSVREIEHTSDPVRIGVVGTGYVGLTTGACLAHLGHPVVCTDLDVDKIERLRRGEIPIVEDGLDVVVAAGIESGLLTFEVGAEAAATGNEVVFLCVPTPQGADGGADLDPGHRFLFDLHVGALAELDADPETESFGGALVGGGVYYGPLTWLSLGLTYERIFLGRDDLLLDSDESIRTSRSANALWLNGRLYPYEDDNIALFFEVAGGPVWQDISVSRTLSPPGLSLIHI